jgi:hypothetical protein
MTIPKHKNSYKRSWFSGLPPIILGALAGMDEQGETILGSWLYGGGTDHDVFDDPFWSKYMMADPTLAGQVFINLRIAVEKLLKRKQLGRFAFSERFHGQFSQNSGMSGYALLHGTNSSVGDFLITGFAEIADAYDPVEGDYDIRIDLTSVFNDIVDPNGNYWTDTVRAAVARLVTPNSSGNYRLSIGWTSKCLVEVRNGTTLNFYGYPSRLPIPVRPLPAGKLDEAALQKKWAETIEGKIVAQLNRRLQPTDRAGLADRKQRLLWLFHRLGVYWSSTYIERINRGTDELARLLKARISGELRNEILETLRGKRPPDPEPT